MRDGTWVVLFLHFWGRLRECLVLALVSLVFFLSSSRPEISLRLFKSAKAKTWKWARTFNAWVFLILRLSCQWGAKFWDLSEATCGWLWWHWPATLLLHMLNWRSLTTWLSLQLSLRHCDSLAKAYWLLACYQRLFRLSLSSSTCSKSSTQLCYLIDSLAKSLLRLRLFGASICLTTTKRPLRRYLSEALLLVGNWFWVTCLAFTFVI